jgi:hypothetical protein
MQEAVKSTQSAAAEVASAPAIAAPRTSAQVCVSMCAVAAMQCWLLQALSFVLSSLRQLGCCSHFVQVAAEIAAKRAANKPSAQLKLFGTK